MGVSREGSEGLAGARGAHGEVMSVHEGEAGRDRGREDLGVERFVSPRLRQVLAAAEPGAREELLATGAERLRRNGPDGLEAVLSELLEALPGSFYPVYNSERRRWELGIR